MAETDLITKEVRSDMTQLMTNWKTRHRAISPRSLRGKFARELGLDHLDVVNCGARYSYMVVRVRKGEILSRDAGQVHGPDEEVLAQCAKRMLCNGAFSGRFFARLVTKTDGVSVTLFTKKAAWDKNISISGPSRRDITMDAAGKFFHLLESVRPPALLDGENGSAGVELPLEQDHYRVINVRSWQTNQVTVADFGDNLSMSISGIRSDARSGPSHSNPPHFFSWNIYPGFAGGCTSIGLFDTAKVTFLNSQDYFYTTLPGWIKFFRTHVGPRVENPEDRGRGEERRLLESSWERERQK